MMKINYLLTKNVVARAASTLNWDLNSLTSSVYIINTEGRMINGKSLIGILSGNLKETDKIEILYDKKEDLHRLKFSFNKVGKEIS